MPADPLPLKIVVAGGSGAGKTTLVRALSEIPPLLTEEPLTTASATVAMDFGRITVDETLILSLFGTPGQDRFWFMWEEIARGCVGAVVNGFPNTDRFSSGSVADALVLPPGPPVVRLDAPHAGSCLATLVEHAVARTELVPG